MDKCWLNTIVVKELKLWIYSILVGFWINVPWYSDAQYNVKKWLSFTTKNILFYSLTKAQQGHTAIGSGTSQNWIKRATLTKNTSGDISAHNQKKKYNIMSFIF